jgi:hypothetical protein
LPCGIVASYAHGAYSPLDIRVFEHVRACTQGG